MIALCIGAFIAAGSIVAIALVLGRRQNTAPWPPILRTEPNEHRTTGGTT